MGEQPLQTAMVRERTANTQDSGLYKVELALECP